MRASAPVPKKDGSSGQWYFVFDSVHPKPDGSRRQMFRRGFATRAVAKAALDAALKDDRALTGNGTGMTVGSVIEQFIRTKRLAGKAPGTIAFYEWAASHAETRWGGWSAEKLTSDHLDEAYVEMLAGGRRLHRRDIGTTSAEKPMSARSVEAIHKTVKAAYALAINKGQLIRNPAALATPPRAVEPRRSWYTPEQVGRFLDYVSGLGEQCPLPLGLIDALVDTGGRRGEVLALRWSDVDLGAGTAHITRQVVAHPTTKELEMRPTKRPRSKSVIGLHPATVSALRQRRSQQSAARLLMGSGWPLEESVHGGLIFTFEDGRVIPPDTLTKIIARLSEKSGLPRLTPHGLRHAFASAALSARVPVEVVAARLGNTPRVVQEVYAHVIPADDQAAAQLVGDLYRSPSGATS